MTVATWIWIGNKPLIDNSQNSNITQSQANAANGWTATGTNQIKVVDVKGPNWSNSNPWNTTYQDDTSSFTYTSPTPSVGFTNSGRIRTFIYADFEIETENAAGQRVTITKRGIVMQANNGDVFIRPAASTVNEWNDFTIIYSIKVKNALRIDSDTHMASVGFNPQIKDVVIAPPPCFTLGTKILTDRGETLVETLRVGDLVWTRDHGHQAIRWIGGRRLTADDLAANPHLRPIRIVAGALGANTPAEDLLVSPQHRILVRSKIAHRMTGEHEILVAAKHLVGLDGISVALDVDEVEYFHFLVNSHAVVMSNGAESESLYPGPEALKGLDAEAQHELAELMPELFGEGLPLPTPARLLMAGRASRQLAQRHQVNGMTILSPSDQSVPLH